ncbi:protein kinase [Nocardia sp. NPDC057668]|uniref:serine/threonine-protein kinase n=1 Tax=Nocardia sp. NPDC057668 TaxID=3346202 RepID=UPI00366BF835
MLGDGKLGHYRLEELLGQGGMGQVWLAYDTRMGRDVALKVLPAELADDADYRQRFEREARLAAKLRGPHVVPIHNFGELDGRLFIDMELVDGVDLGQVLHDRGPLPVTMAVDIVRQLAQALDIAHDAGLVHRDIKPSNTLLLPNGFVYLIDFGLARGAGQTALTSTGAAVGTWGYMAPERFSGEGGIPSDVYSLACVLYECLTARRPFGDSAPAQQMLAHMTSPPPRASGQNSAVPAGLDEVIVRGLAKDPARRFDTAGELAASALAAIQEPTAPRAVFAPPRDPVPTSAQPSSSPRSYVVPGAYSAPQPYPEPPPPAARPYGAPLQAALGRAESQPRPTGYAPSAPQYDYVHPSVPPGAAAPLRYPMPPQPATHQPGHSEQPWGYAPIAPGRPKPVNHLGRMLWWVLLGVCTVFFGFLSMVCVFGLFVGDQSIATRVAINVFFHVPTAGFVWLVRREVRKHQGR